MAVPIKKSYTFAAENTGYSVVRLSRLLWEQEVASSNLAIPTKGTLDGVPFFVFTNFIIAIQQSFLHTQKLKSQMRSQPFLVTFAVN